jgi:hypothetical protein
VIFLAAVFDAFCQSLDENSVIITQNSLGPCLITWKEDEMRFRRLYEMSGELHRL